MTPSKNRTTALDHRKAHWASCSIDLPNVDGLWNIHSICDLIPQSILRVKGCTQVGEADEFTYFERRPDGEIHIRPFRGTPVTGPMLLVVGPGSDPSMLREAVEKGLAKTAEKV